MRTETESIDPGDDIIEGWAIVDRIDYLARFEEDADEENPILDEDEVEELRMLRELMEEIREDAFLICESYFEEYARQLAEDIGAIGGETQWPATCIDWEQAADDLKMGFTSVEFGEYTYYYDY